MLKLMQPFKWEKTLVSTWSTLKGHARSFRFRRRRANILLTWLPCEAASVVARLSKEGAADYDVIKAGLLRKYRLSAEAFRQRFRHDRKQRDESYPEFAYNMKANITEWLKGTDCFESRDQVVESLLGAALQ